MQNKSRAFTLIELLVVVLIIGILAAVAVPQYELAVEKSRAMEGVVKLKALSEALERHYLETNQNLQNTADLEKLDISVANTALWTVVYEPTGYLALRRKKGNTTLYQLAYLPRSNPSSPGRRSCDMQKQTDDNSIASKVCKSLCGTSTLTVVWGGNLLGCIIK